MTSSFGGISQASGALNAARYGLDVTGQNIANASTPGYTRQVAQQGAVGGAVGVPTIHSGSITEGGVRITSVDRLADPVVNARARTEHGRQAAADTTAARLTDLENIFTEPSDNGLAEKLNDFWNAWGDVANDPAAQVPRQMLLSAGTAVTTTLHSMNSALDNVGEASFDSLQAQLTSANTAAQSLADLNAKIAIGTASGANVNPLLDQRDTLLDTLSKAVGGVATIAKNGTASVKVGGQDLVTAAAPGAPSTANQLAVSPGSFVAGSAAGAYTITIGGGPTVPALGPSTAQSELDTLDTVIPAYHGQLDAVAQALADSANGQQAKGFDLAGASGVPMFNDGAAPPAAPSTTVTAANITVAFTDYTKVAASDVQSKDPSGNPTGNADGNNALAAATLGSSAASPDTAYQSLIGDLGRKSASAKQLQATQSSITASVDSLQQQSSGVSLDEEVSNMLTYQMAYQASSRVLTTMDSMLDTLINHTGVVGLA